MSSGANPVNKACVLLEPEKVVCQEMPFPTYGDDDVLVEVVCSGICGSDLHIMHGGYKTNGPHIFGHESSGIVSKIGANVKKLKVGDRVAIEPNVPCRKCRSCKTGHPNHCKSIFACGLPPFNGSICQWFSLPSDLAVKIPDNVDWKAAGCIQPLAVAVHLAERAGIRAHQNVAVYGSGPLGLLVMAVAKAYGAAKIVAFDISQSRLDYALKHYATHGFLSGNKPEEMGAMAFANSEASRILKATGIEDGVDVAVDASGAEACMQAGAALLRHGGVFLQAGIGKDIASFPMLTVVGKELDVRGTVRYSPGSFEQAIDLLSRGLVDLSEFVTATYPIERSKEAFEAVKAGKDIKVLILSKDISPDGKL